MKKTSMLRTMRIIWGTILGGLLLFIFSVLFALKHGFEVANDPALEYVLQLIAISFLIAGVLISRYYSRRTISKLAGSAVEKSVVYRKTFIINLAVVEGAGFFACVAYLISGSSNLLLLSLISVMLLLTHYPSTSKVANDLKISVDELMELE
jgi:hypothetical protein